MLSFVVGSTISAFILTGIFTDLGIMLGGALRGKALDKRKASLFIIALGFICGGTLGKVRTSPLASAIAPALLLLPTSM